MPGLSLARRARPKDEAEKPFWISFADLMTALMVLFLVVMAVALTAVTKKVTEQQTADDVHNKKIQVIVSRVEELVKLSEFKEIDFNRITGVIAFGEQAQFPLNRSTLTAQQQLHLRKFVAALLEQVDDDLARAVLKEIVVDGFTDKSGTYLGNLNLSLQRSQRVLCALFDKPAPGEPPIPGDRLKRIRDLFVVGGYSFNDAKASAEASRRVEMRLRFLGVNEARKPTEDVPLDNLGACALTN